MRNFRTILLISLLVIIGLQAESVKAARLVPGSVPQYQPLQPPPVDNYPNYQNNIQFSDPGYPQADNSNQAQSGSSANDDIATKLNQAAASVTGQLSQTQGWPFWLKLLIAGVFAGAIVWLVWWSLNRQG